mmetsp:Transcript_57953/g.103684  ORF Transcript_57953/g.103684 Transcript_57953/m.103684 type:complete len:123 (-) Transcript_57953:29-397(-)
MPTTKRSSSSACGAMWRLRARASSAGASFTIVMTGVQKRHIWPPWIDISSKEADIPSTAFNRKEWKSPEDRMVQDGHWRGDTALAVVKNAVANIRAVDSFCVLGVPLAKHRKGSNYSHLEVF